MLFVTGVNEPFFYQLFLLRELLRRNSPGVELLVCDFGVSGPQRRFLREQGILLEKPANAGAGLHPWHYKSMLGRYVAGLDAQPVVWLDADLIILSDIKAAMAALSVQMQAQGQILAAATQGISIGQWLADNQAPHFAHLVAGADVTGPYLSAGMFLCRSAEWLAAWQEACLAMPLEMLFEQNAFNLMAMRAGLAVRPLDPWLWNLAGQHVRQTTFTQSGTGTSPVLESANGRAHILHATSIDRARDIKSLRWGMDVNGVVFHPRLQFIAHPEELLHYQINLAVDGLQASAHALVANGVLDADPG